MPQSEISDEAKQVIRMHERMLALMQVSLDILGPEFVFNQTIAPLIEPSLDYLLQHFLQAVTRSSQKLILKIIKYILMILKGVSTASENSAKLAQVFLTNKAKKSWAAQPQDSDQTLQIMNQTVQNSICNKIL